MCRDKFMYLIRRSILAMRKWNIFTRLFIMFVFATLFPMIIMEIYSYQVSSSVIQQKVVVSINEVLGQIVGNVDKKIEKVRNDGIEISYMTEIQDVLAEYGNYNKRMLNTVKLDVTAKMSGKYVFDNIVSNIVLYTLDYDRIGIYGDDIYYANLKEDYLDDFLRCCYEQDGKTVFRVINRSHEKDSVRTADERACIIAGRAVKHSHTGKIIGYMLLQINEKNFSDIFMNIDQQMGAQIVIVDREGIVVSSAGAYAQVGEKYGHDVADILRHSEAGTGSGGIMIDNERMVPLCKKVDNEWLVIFLIPEKSLRVDLLSVLMSFLEICVVALIFSGVFSLVCSYSIVSPLKYTINGITRFEKGDLSVTLEEKGNDEITMLERQFNKMAKEIDNLIKKVEQNERQKRKLEIKALQAQVNPHFLANTLNTVSYLAKMRKETSIESLVNAVIELLRHSMRNDDSFNTIEQEIDLIRNYVLIWDYKLMGKFTVDIRIEPEIRSCLVPRLVLQPIVENAIIHGIEPSEKPGMILIKGDREEDRLLISVTDNGTGMSKLEIQDSMKKNWEKSRFNGIGIGNVDQRLKLMFGEDFGLEITGEKGFFTMVTICLPILDKEDMSYV